MFIAYDHSLDSQSDQQAAVAALYEALIGGWNETDADAFAAPFADDGTVIGFDGSELVGRRAIVAEMSRIFADHRPARYVSKVRTIELLGSDVLLLRAVVGMIPPNEAELHPDRNAWQTLVATRRDGRWQIVLFQNTPAQFHGRPDLAERLTDELTQLLRRRPT
jgi:uncharacterized protein (TIGR02246 family)